MGSPVPPKFAVGVVTETFVDSHRTTPAWNQSPSYLRGLSSRRSSIPRPALLVGNPQREAAPDKAAGPFPLVVFAHGLGGTPQDYITLLTAWASAGFVVAAPLFPLSNANVPVGPDAGHVVNQPKDMSYVIDSVLLRRHLSLAEPSRAWSTPRRSVPPVTRMERSPRWASWPIRVASIPESRRPW